MAGSILRITPRGRRACERVATLAAALLLVACDGPQSTLAPAGRAAERIAALWWWMAGGALLVWTAVVGLVLYALHTRREHGPAAGRLLIVGGAVVPAAVLSVLLGFGLSMLPDLLEPGPADGLRIEVTGEEWWWRVRYHAPGGEPVDLANEIRLPVGERVEFTLTSRDVIHSFWIPSLGGKMDMTPGRVTRLALEPTRTGVFRGACAEFCGTSHAFMNFVVVVTGRDEFDGWLAAQRAPARVATDDLARRGRDLFLSGSCAECHAVRGTPARGATGPDLTHVGSRLSLGAGLLPNDPEAFARWIADPGAVKPAAHMPSFREFTPEDDLRALAAYLDGLL